MTGGPIVLVVLLGSLGDLVRGLSLAHQLKVNFPGAQVQWVVDAQWRSLVEGHRYIDRVIVFDRSKGGRALIKLLQELRLERPDITLDLQRILKSGLITLLSGASRRVSFARVDSKEGNWLFSNEQTAEWREKSSKLSAYLSFITRIGGSIRYPLDFSLPAKAESDAVRQIVAEHDNNYLVAALGSSWGSKDWPQEGYARVIATLTARFRRKIVLVGAKSHLVQAEQLVAGAAAGSVENLVGKTTLPELALLLAHCAGGFGPDSGPAHIAGAVGARYVTLFGPTSAQLVAPYGNEDRVITPALGCSPCYRRVCPGLGTLCMRMIAPEAVVERLEGVLQGVG